MRPPVTDPSISCLPALLPPAVLLLFAAWCGTFAGAARGDRAAAGWLLVLVLAALAGGAWRDPLRLGRGRWLLLALVVSVGASWWTSPVPRAGRVAILVLPAFLLLPAAVARLWATPERRRLGLTATSLGVAAVALGSLVTWQLWQTPGTSLPLGHHNLLAAWLVVLLPLAALPWRDGGLGRWLASGAVAATVAALLASRSLTGAAGLVAIVVVWAVASWRRGHSRRPLVLALVALVAVGVLQHHRLAGLVAGSDASVAARETYVRAGLRGLEERPLLGWGPGAVAWTASAFLAPVPGLNPPDEIVAHLHAFPVDLVYEIGLGGLLLFLGTGLALLRRRRTVADPDLARAAGLGLLGLAVVSLGGLPLSVTALPVALALVVGAWLAADAPPAAASPSSSSNDKAYLPWIYAAVAGAFLAPLLLAQIDYDRAVASASLSGRLQPLERAARLDPDFPLYTARLAWLRAEIAGVTPAVAEQALAAAEAAQGVAVLWLKAGWLGQEADVAWARQALIHACNLNPFGAVAPFRLAVADPYGPRAPEWAGRALLAEPLLVAAIDWKRERRRLPAQAVSVLAQVPGVEESWRRALEREVSLSLPAATGLRRLALSLDQVPAESWSLLVFRRTPWPGTLVEIGLFSDVLPELGLVPATTVRWTYAAVFDRTSCGLGGLRR